MMRRLSLSPLALAAVMILSPAAARAAQNTGTIDVSANVVASCEIDATALAFGDYVGAQKDTAATITVNCNTASVGYTVTMDDGLFHDAATSKRQMNRAGARLSYDLYTDSNRTSFWKDAVSVAGTTSAASPSTDGSMIVYGRIPANQILMTQGEYTDTVTMTVTF